MKCFEVCGDYVFICFANGKMEVYNKGTQAPVRKPIAAHGSEIKFIAKGSNSVMYTSDLENQVCSVGQCGTRMISVCCVACPALCAGNLRYLSQLSSNPTNAYRTV